jgi:hypothetical protein
MGLVPNRPVTGASDANVVSVTEHGPWTHINDAYRIWNDRERRRRVVRSLVACGEVFSFQLPDPDMSYAFARYVGGRRVRLRVVDSPHWSDQVLRIDRANACRVSRRTGGASRSRSSCDGAGTRDRGGPGGARPALRLGASVGAVIAPSVVADVR